MTTNGTDFSLDGKTAVVTGASYGLGVTFANALAGAGANVVLPARSKDKIESEARRGEGSGASTLAVQCDVGDEQRPRHGRGRLGQVRPRRRQ